MSEEKICSKCKKEIGLKVLPKSVAKDAHWVQLAQLIADTRDEFHLSERELAKKFSISKSEIHRLLDISQIDHEIKVKIKDHGVEKYVILDWLGIEDKNTKTKVCKMIKEGKITKRRHLRFIISGGKA